MDLKIIQAVDTDLSVRSADHKLVTIRIGPDAIDSMSGDKLMLQGSAHALGMVLGLKQCQCIQRPAAHATMSATCGRV